MFPYSNYRYNKLLIKVNSAVRRPTKGGVTALHLRKQTNIHPDSQDESYKNHLNI